MIKGLPHADGLVVAYLPKERILAYADMFNLPTEASGAGSESASRRHGRLRRQHGSAEARSGEDSLGPQPEPESTGHAGRYPQLAWTKNESHGAYHRIATRLTNRGEVLSETVYISAGCRGWCAGVARWWSRGRGVSAQRASSAMMAAANSFLSSLTPEQRKQATFPFEADERMHWNFIPDETFPRNGLPLKAMTEPQRKAAHALLRSGLSDRGYQTYTAIIQLENILRAVEGGGKMARDPDAYSVLGLRHAGPEGDVGLARRRASRLAALQRRERRARSPARRASPDRTRRKCATGPRRGSACSACSRIPARALVTALDATQRTTAIFNATAPNEIVTTNKLDIKPLAPRTEGVGDDGGRSAIC